MHLISKFENFQKVPKCFAIRIIKDSISFYSTISNLLILNRTINKSTHKLNNFTIFGDTHGQFLDVIDTFRNPLVGFPSIDSPFLFNGDMADRGEQSTELLLTLLAIRLSSPLALYIIRGNHETRAMNEVYGFDEEVRRKYDEEVLGLFRRLFEVLPVAAVVGGQVFVTHGGIGPLTGGMTLHQIDRARSEKVKGQEEPSMGGAVAELLWSGESFIFIYFLLS
jgi:serine/threonine-protein phosphatase 5